MPVRARSEVCGRPGTCPLGQSRPPFAGRTDRPSRRRRPDRARQRVCRGGLGPGERRESRRRARRTPAGERRPAGRPRRPRALGPCGARLSQSLRRRRRPARRAVASRLRACLRGDDGQHVCDLDRQPGSWTGGAGALVDRSDLLAGELRPCHPGDGHLCRPRPGGPLRDPGPLGAGGGDERDRGPDPGPGLPHRRARGRLVAVPAISPKKT